MICAIEIQRVLRARNASLSADHRMDFRMGIHMGDVRVEGGRIYGDGVNIAARLEALADAGGICISSTGPRSGEVTDKFSGSLVLCFRGLRRFASGSIPVGTTNN